MSQPSEYAPFPLFHITQQQKDRRDSWCKKHGETAHARGVRDMSGAAFLYTILPTGMGDNITIECIWCPGTKIILTEGDGGEFLYDEEGRKTWCGKTSFMGPRLCEDRNVHMHECMDQGKHLTHIDKDGDCQFCYHH